MIVIDEKFLVIKEINGYLAVMILINSFRSGQWVSALLCLKQDLRKWVQSCTIEFWMNVNTTKEDPISKNFVRMRDYP
jgi:hypothetical protein